MIAENFANIHEREDPIGVAFPDPLLCLAQRFPAFDIACA
jgi:hypothetical protein